MEDICGMLNCFGGNYTVSDILSALVFGDVCLMVSVVFYLFFSVPAVFSMWCHYDLSFGLFLIAILVPGGANGIPL